MKTKTLLILSQILFIFSLEAQQFELASGPVTSKISDSRSVNFFDLNNDGWEDIYISNGLNGGQKDLLYLNDGTGNFTEITDMEIVQASNPSDGASFADYNNDGHIDGVVSSWYGAEDLLYLNDPTGAGGNGNLVYNPNAGIATGSFAETAAFGDYDNDGWVDLYITNSDGDRKNYLYKNLKNGKFERITDHILVGDTKLSRGAIWGDFNGDNITDLYVANENNAANDLFYGTGSGNFEKVSTGLVVLTPASSMTGSWGDIDNDLDFDLFVGNSGFFQPAKNHLFINKGDKFEFVSGDPVTDDNRCTYGSAFGDYDNDGDLDLVVSNGFCNTGLANNLYENQGDGTFIDASDQLVSNFNTCSFGTAWGDVNNDGFLDLVTANCKNNNSSLEKTNTLLINKGNDNNWLKIKLIGIESNKNAIGAKIKIKAIVDGNEVWQIREIRSQSGYAGQNSMIAHFGLKDADSVDSLVINWPSGTLQILENIEVNQQLTIEEEMTNNWTENELERLLKFEAFPNPITKNDSIIRLLIESETALNKSELFLYDSLGRMILNQRINILSGQMTLNIPLSGYQLQSGIYQIVLQTPKGKILQKISVK